MLFYGFKQQPGLQLASPFLTGTKKVVKCLLFPALGAPSGIGPYCTIIMPGLVIDLRAKAEGV